jgi:hypothetical protein
MKYMYDRILRKLLQVSGTHSAWMNACIMHGNLYYDYLTIAQSVPSLLLVLGNRVGLANTYQRQEKLDVAIYHFKR